MQENPEKAFAKLVEAYQLPLLRMCVLHLRDRELARDAVQETFIKAYRALPDFRGECSVQSWLMRIAINTCRDMQRSWWHRHVRTTADDLPIAYDGVSDEAVAVTEAISRLPPRLKEAVLLYYYQNMQLDEIAQALGIHPSSVSGRLKRARAKLRAGLKGVFEDD